MFTRKCPAEPRLSVAMIARDAEQRIAASLDSVREIADEILVADTGSLDRTRHVALARATHVVTIPWIDDFSAARNACLDRVKGEWVLWLDAGETIDPATAADIRRFVDEDAEPNCVYLFCVQLPPAKPGLAGEQISRVRLIPNRKDLRYKGRVRESLRDAIAAAGMTVEPTSLSIRRSAVDHDSARKARRARRDLKLAEIEIREQGSSASALIAMGEAWSTLGEARQAVDCFQQALVHAPRGSTEMLEAYYGLLAAYDSQPQAQDEQLKACLAALEIFPFDAQLLCAVGSYMQNRGRIDLACRAYQSAVTHGQINLETWHLTALREVAVCCATLTLEALDQDDEAQRMIEAALADGGESPPLRQRLIDLHIKHNRRQQALEQIGKSPTAPPSGPQLDALRTAVRGACLAAKKDWPQARSYLQTAYDAGCRDVICLRWLVAALVACEQAAAAMSIAQEWLRVLPDSVEARKVVEAMSRPAANEPVAGALSPIATQQAGRKLRVDQPANKSPNTLPGLPLAMPSVIPDATAGA